MYLFMCRLHKEWGIETFEPRYEKTGLLHYTKTKTQISCAVTAQMISAFVYAVRIVNPSVTSHLLWLHSPVYVGLGQKPRRPVFSQRGAFKVLVQSEA